MKLVLVFLALAFAWCNASDIICQSYNGEKKLFLQTCDNFKYRSSQNCYTINGTATVVSSDVQHLIIQGCDSRLILDASEKYENLEQLDISHSGLKTLGNISKPFGQLTELNATFNWLFSVPKEIIAKCPSLETLDLSYNHLERINHGDFEQPQKIKTIDLSRNQLNFIHTAAFANLSDLKVVRLNHNQLLTIPALRFLNHPIEVHLEENSPLTTFNCTAIAAMSPVTVYLSWYHIVSFLGDQGCGARKFRIIQHHSGDVTGYEGISTEESDNWYLHCNDQSFRNLQNFVAGPMGFENIHDILPLISQTVRKLDLSENNVGFLNQTLFERFRTLTELRLNNAQLTVFDVSALNTNNQNYLTHLDISHNHLKEIKNPRMLQYFGHLIEFNAGGNQLENASDIIRNLPPTVQHLNMANSANSNNIDDVNKLAQFRELTHLDLTNKHLSIADLSAFRGLINFNVSGNDLSKVDYAQFQYFNRLQEFRAANCQIANVAEAIQYFPSTVEKLDLSGNLATIFIPRSFERLRYLKELSLSGMGLYANDSTIFEPLTSLTSLTHLDISSNELEYLDASRFPNTLQQLHLHGNNLQRIENFDRKHLPALNVLSVSQNLLECDYLDQLRAQFKDSVILIDDPQYDPFHQKNDTCHSNVKFIILCIFVAGVILLITLCAVYFCRKRLCNEN